MADFNNINNQVFTYESIVLVDEASSGTTYIGTSINSNVTGSANWRIKKVWKDGTVTRSEFPDGDQSYKFVWDDRAGYTYQ
jgi:hypothetical protein